jgi:hypothetical protein
MEIDLVPRAGRVNILNAKRRRSEWRISAAAVGSAVRHFARSRSRFEKLSPWPLDQTGWCRLLPESLDGAGLSLHHPLGHDPRRRQNLAASRFTNTPKWGLIGRCSRINSFCPEAFQSVNRRKA